MQLGADERAPVSKVEQHDPEVDRLLEKLRTGDPTAQLLANDKLASMGPKVLPQLLGPLRTDDYLAAWIAGVIAEWGFQSRSAAPVLAERLARGLDDAPVMAHALYYIGGPALPYVVQALAKGTDVGRQWAMDALDNLLEPRPEPFLPEVTRALRSDWTPLREEAASVLASLGVLARPAFSDILAAVADPDEIVQGNIADALGKFVGCEGTSSMAIDALLEVLNNGKYSYSRRKAAIALGCDSVRDARALIGLWGALDDPDIGDQAALSLLRLGVGTAKVVDVLLEGVNSAPTEKLIEAAAQLRTGGLRARRAAVRLLIVVCRADSPELRAKAVSLLGFVANADQETVQPELLRALEDKEQSVRDAAQDALRALHCIEVAK